MARVGSAVIERFPDLEDRIKTLAKTDVRFCGLCEELEETSNRLTELKGQQKQIVRIETEILERRCSDLVKKISDVLSRGDAA